MGVVVGIYFPEEMNSEINAINLISAGLICCIMPFIGLLHMIKNDGFRDVWVDEPRTRTIDIFNTDADHKH